MEGRDSVQYHVESRCLVGHVFFYCCQVHEFCHFQRTTSLPVQSHRMQLTKLHYDPDMLSARLHFVTAPAYGKEDASSLLQITRTKYHVRV